MTDRPNNFTGFSSIPSVIEELRAGRFVIIVDDASRENEGDLCMAGEFITPQAVTFLINHARGFLCVAVSQQVADKLELPPMVRDNRSRFGTPFTVSVDASQGITTGVSASDRARTIGVMAADDTGPDALVRPGHVSPLVARPGGTLVRAGHTEAAVDLVTLAGLKPVAVTCEVMKPDGEMARLPDLEEMADRFGFKICTTADIIRHRHQSEYLISKTIWLDLRTRYGVFTLHYYRSEVDEREHIAICCGEVGAGGSGPAPAIEKPVLVRVHDECFTGDILGSLRCDCGEQLARSLAMIRKEGLGVVLYMRQEGRGIGLEKKLCAYRLQDEGLDTVEANEQLGLPADKREYGIGAQILRHLGIRKMRLISNNPRKFSALSGYGLEIVERIPMEIKPGEDNRRYLQTKRDKLGHMLGLEGKRED